jgi:hypothetical protein
MLTSWDLSSSEFVQFCEPSLKHQIIHHYVALSFYRNKVFIWKRQKKDNLASGSIYMPCYQRYILGCWLHGIYHRPNSCNFAKLVWNIRLFTITWPYHSIVTKHAYEYEENEERKIISLLDRYTCRVTKDTSWDVDFMAFIVIRIRTLFRGLSETESDYSLLRVPIIRS